MFLLCQVPTIVAQTPGFEDDVVDVPAAPIDQWVLPMIVLGIAMRYYFMKKKKQAL